MDARLVAAFRALLAAAPAGEPQDRDWQAHLRDAVRRRARQMLGGLATPLAADLERLAAWEVESGDSAHGWVAAQQAYGPAVAAWERKHGSLAPLEAPPQEQPLLDAGAGGGADAALLAQLLQHGLPSGGGGGAAEASESEQRAAGSGGSVLPLLYRSYKKLILWDVLLLGPD